MSTKRRIFVNVKNIIVIFTFLIFWVGVAVIGLASYTIYNHHIYAEDLADPSTTPTIISLGCGVFIAINGFLGCCGALHEKHKLLYMYAVVGLILAMGELTAAILLTISPEEAADQVRRQMERHFINFEINDKEILDRNFVITEAFPHAMIVRHLQANVKCCGLDSWRDWAEKYRLSIPPNSCCTNGGPCDTKIPENLYQEGCYEKTLKLIGGLIPALAYTAFALGFIQLILVILSFGLGKSISRRCKRRRRRRVIR